MTMVPMIKKCPKCRKKYSFNPDVGLFNCPYCRGLGSPFGSLADKLKGKKTKDSSADLNNKL